MRVLLISMNDPTGGIEKLELEWIKNIKGIKIDLIVPYNETIKDKKIYNLNIRRNSIINKLKFNKRFDSFLKKNKYDIIHINSGVLLFDYQVARIAHKNKINRIIVHSHSVPKHNIVKKIINWIVYPFFNNLIDDKIACSYKASSLFHFKNDVEIIPNAININDYKFDNNKRNKFIKEFKLHNNKVYGHVGSFTDTKNHDLLVDIFYNIVRVDSNSALLLIGDGKLKESIINKVKRLNIEDKVLFLNNRDDVKDLLNVIDVFIFPSKSEGFGLSLIEAQTNGIVTFASNTIPKEVNMSSLYHTFDINNDPKNIANKILKTPLNTNRENAYKDIKYDIKDMCKIIEEIYKR